MEMAAEGGNATGMERGGHRLETTHGASQTGESCGSDKNRSKIKTRKKVREKKSERTRERLRERQ